MRMEISLKYGLKEIPLDLSWGDLLGVIEPKEIFPDKAPSLLLEEALDDPLDSSPFSELHRKGQRIAIITPDITRQSGSHLYLPILVKRLNELGISNEKISIIVALGIHSKQNKAQDEIITGKDVYQKIKVYNHDPWDRKNLLHLGNTSRGTPVEVNRKVVEADRIILTGNISFHYLAGFGGGRKGILPGVASYQSCVVSHLLVLNSPHLGGRHPLARTGILDGNPFHEDMAEASLMLENIFLLNTVLNHKKEIIRVVAGDHISAHRKGCDFLFENFALEVSQRADLAIVSCGGFPYDINFIQAHKTIENAIGIVKEGGIMILLAQCSQGLGNQAFLNWFELEDLGQLETELRKNFEINGQTAYTLLTKIKRIKIILISQLPKEVVKRMKLWPADSIEETLFIAKGFLGRNPSTYIVPQGGITFLQAEK